MSVREILKVPDHDLLDELGIAQHEARLVEDVEAEHRRVLVHRVLVNIAEMPAGARLEEHGILEVAEDEARVG